MLNPSYSSLIKILNEDVGTDEHITSRYSVVIAAAKRARQIVGGATYSADDVYTDKAVSIAVSEIQSGNIKILPGSVSAWEIAQLEQFPSNIPVVIDDSYVSDESDHIKTYADEDGDDSEHDDNDFDDSDDDWDDEDESDKNFEQMDDE